MTRFFIIVFVILTTAVSAQAQATRTWVSGVGDDVNPGSRTAPCKTFPGALSKTAAGGEINCIDPGGFGAVTITKSITIDGGDAGFGRILASGTTGIRISAGANDVVVLRNLHINGAGSGLVGIRITSAKTVIIENCVISGFGATGGVNGRGINDERTTGGKLIISNTLVRNNAQSGVVILPASGSTPINVSIRGSRLQGNGSAGLAALAGSRVTISDSVISGNTFFGIAVEQPAGPTQFFADSCVISNNGTGIAIVLGAPTVRISNVVVTDNDTGLSGGPMLSFGNNKIAGNTAGNVLPTGSSGIGLQ